MEAETAEKTIFAALWVDAGATASTQAPQVQRRKVLPNGNVNTYSTDNLNV